MLKYCKNNLTDEGAVFPNKPPLFWVAPNPPKPELAVVVVVDPNSEDWVVLAPKRPVPVVLPNNPPEVEVLPNPKFKKEEKFNKLFQFLNVKMFLMSKINHSKSKYNIWNQIKVLL